MTRILLLTLFGVACLLSEVRADEVACAKFAQAYEASNKTIGASFAQSLGDSSAPRQTNRELEVINQRLRQLIVLQQMRAYGCRFPTEISDGGAYLMQALKCQSEMLKGRRDAPECDRDKW